MDLDDWELLPRDEFIHDQNDTISKLSYTKSVIDMNYFQSSMDKNDQIYKEETNSSIGNKIVDIKMESPMSENNGIASQVELKEKDGEEEEIIKKEEENNNNKNNKNGGLNMNNNVWKWAMSGIGAVFSFGFLAASVSLVALGNRSSTKEHRSCNTSEIHFQIYSHDKRMKRVVKRTKRLNEAIAAVRGAPYMTRAHITIGGYYEGL